MKSFISAAAFVAFALSVSADAVVRGTPAPVKRQVVPTDFSSFSSLTDPQVLSSYYAQATSALSQAASAGAPSSLIAQQRSSLDQAFSSAFAAVSSGSPSGNGAAPSSSSSSSGGGGGGKGGAAVGVHLDLPVSLAITGVAGLVAAAFAL